MSRRFQIIPGMIILGIMVERRKVTPSFGSRLHLLVEEMALTQRQISEFADVNEGSVSRWLSGSIPDLETVERLAKKTGVALEWLAFGEGTLEPKVEGVEAFINRMRKTILPRLDSIINNLDSVLLEEWLVGSDWESFDSMRGHFGARRARLVQLVRSFEQLPADDVPNIEKRLFGEEILSGPLVDLRFKLCRMLFLDCSASDDDVISRCQETLAEVALQSGKLIGPSVNKRHPKAAKRLARGKKKPSTKGPAK